MQIQEQDLYHGAALTQIAEHASFKALNRASAKYGHYLVNTDRHVFIKYRTSRKSPWQFTFSREEVAAIASAGSAHRKVWVCLVCGDVTICALAIDETRQVLDLENPSQQWIRVEIPKGGSCHVSGHAGSLRKTVPHKAFPGKVFV